MSETGVGEYPLSPEAKDFIETAGILAEPYEERIADLEARIEELAGERDRAREECPVTTGYGVEWVRADGTTYIGPASTLHGARSLVEHCRGKDWEPQAARVMQADCGEWLPVEAQEGAA